MPQEKMVNFIEVGYETNFIEQNLEKKYNIWYEKNPNTVITSKIVKMRTEVLDNGSRVSVGIIMSITIFYKEVEL